MIFLVKYKNTFLLVFISLKFNNILIFLCLNFTKFIKNIIINKKILWSVTLKPSYKNANFLENEFINL